MDGFTMRTLREYIHELRGRDRNDNRTGQQPSFDTTTEDDSTWDKRYGSRDGRCDQYQTGQGRNRLC
jgi:hypothetical protein